MDSYVLAWHNGYPLLSTQRPIFHEIIHETYLQPMYLRRLKFVCFLKRLESFRRFSYKATEIMEQHERRSVSSFECGVNWSYGEKEVAWLLGFCPYTAHRLLVSFLASQIYVIIVACLHVFVALTIVNKYLLFAMNNSFDTHVFCNWQSPYFTLGLNLNHPRHSLTSNCSICRLCSPMDLSPLLFSLLFSSVP